MSALTPYLVNFRYAFRPSKPRLTLRLANAVVRSGVLRQPRLRYVDFSLDFKCNLHCEHCFATALAKPRGRRMEREDYRRVSAEAMALGAVNFSFQGGEPLMLDGLGDIVSACAPDRNVISVTTNGTLVTPERARYLRRIGVDILTVSLDSSIPEEHDRFRGVPGTFERTMAGIRAALDAGLRVSLGTVVTRQNVRSDGITGLVRLAEELRCLLYVIFPVQAGKWKSAEEVLLTDEDVRYVYDLTRRTRWVRTDFQANLGGYGCGAANEILYVSPHGDVLPCPFLHISMGNVLEEPLAALRGRALENPLFSSYHDRCLVSTDPDFIARHLSQTFSAKQLPLPWRSVFPSGGPDRPA
jgi:MoaA/NifB/PqqE/SkfB family radical SAM enzyme